MYNFKDEYIKKKMKEDESIPDSVNAVFEKFKSENLVKENITNTNKTNSYDKIKEILDYKRMNRILSIAAVFLCVFIVGTGAIIYNKKIGEENTNINISTNSLNGNNQGLKYNSEEIINEYENHLVKVFLVKNQDVVIQLKDEFIKQYNLNLSSENQYKVENVDKKVKDIFVGCIVDNKTPYVFLLMEDGTIETVQILYDIVIPSGNYQFNFKSQGIVEGLYDVVGFEQQTRKFSNTADLYYYVNAIRKDGVKKEIEVGRYNDWNDKSRRTFDSLNQEYMKYTEPNAVTDDGTNDKVEGNKTIYNLKIDDKYSYYMLNNNFYRINNSTKAEECLANGVNAVFRDNADGKLSVALNKNYTINIVDENIIYNEYDVDNISQFDSSLGYGKVQMEIRTNGSLIVLFEVGSFEELGIHKNETNIKENVRYNVYGESVGVYDSTTNNTVADAKAMYIDKVYPSSTLSLVYAKKDDTIVCIDLKDAIKKSNFHTVKKVITGASNVEAFKTDVVYDNVDGQQVEKYRTIFTIERRENVTFYNREINY